uniref:cupredoxin domain-containing protein n=1 Tax=Sporichthya sp. TaxID=65475 RepID=UPI0017921334
APDPPAGPGTIVIKDFVYSPIPAQVKLGQSITVTNEDSAAHTLTVPGGVDSGTLAQGKSFTFTPAEAGELDYLCDIHQYMKGRIIVE